MWQSNMFVIHVAIISMGFIYGVFATTISFCPEKFEEDLSLYFEEPMDKCDNPEYDVVKLNNIQLKILNKNFIESVIVKSINIEYNDIIDINPDAFKGVPNLYCLNMQQNYQLNILNNFLKYFKHSSLTKLNLAKTMSEIHSLNQYSTISSDKMTEIAPENALPRVTHLDISGNNIEILPDYLTSSFPRLTHLYLSNNRLTSDYVYHIPATTQYLYLEENAFPINLLKLPKNISGLFLSKNQLELHDKSLAYPNYDYDYDYQRSPSFSRQSSYNEKNSNDDVKKDMELLSNLVILSVRKCKNINLLIVNLDKCKNLVDLDMSSNEIESFDKDDFKTLKSLQRFSLDHNTLSSLSFLTHLSSLQNLSIAYNNLTNITSDYFANLRNLKTLNLRGNRISIISKNAFLSLNMLEKLDLAQNNLSKLPSGWLNNSTVLRYLNLKSNLFTSFDSMYGFSNLNHLFLENNCIKQFEMANLKELPSTIVIYMSSIYGFLCEM